VPRTPSAARTSPAELDIPLARTRLDRAAAIMLVGYAVVLSALVAVATALLEGTALLVVLVVLAVAWLVHIGLYLLAWSGLRKVASPLGLHGDALHARSPFGEVVAPWEAVASAVIEPRWRGPMLRVRLVPAGDPRHATIADGSRDSRLMRTIDRRGMRYSLRVLDIAEAQLREAFVVQSAGRVQVA